MKIISVGTIPDETHQVDCANCSTQFAFKRVEATFVENSPFNILSVLCPVCNTTCLVGIPKGTT